MAPSLLFAQSDRPVPYPVFLSPQFERAVEAETRTLTGEPGPAYWTNTAEYTIRATLSPRTHQLRGTETIRYQNNSPDTLRNLFVHVRQNLHQEGSVRNRFVEITGGMYVSEVKVDGQLLMESPPREAPGYAIRGTVMHIRPHDVIPPGGTTTLAFSWSFEVPEQAPRMGREGEEVYYLGYWYPQLAVYDDVNGWTAEPYQGNGEFYMGYGSYDVQLTVPEGWLVAATGTLQNPAEVLSAQARQRLEQAAQSDEVVTIVGEDEREAGVSTADSPSELLTWHFTAENVRDVAISASDRYVWDATHAETGDAEDGVSMIHALHRPDAGSWERGAEFARFSIEFLSDYIMPYPYPHMTAVEGIIGGGMEYPMMTLIGGNRNDRSLFGVTFHELSHMWFPMIVGQNEKQYTWMDEGLTSFNTNEGAAAFFDMDAWDPSQQSYYYIADSGMEVEPMRHADDYPFGTPARGIASYNKPAVALHTLRGLVGQDAFQQAYQEYARRWAYKHPQPYDFFNTVEDVLGEEYDWFWRTMFYETWTLDHAIADVETTESGVVVTIEDQGRSPMPVPVRITYADGTTDDERVPVDVWLSGKRTATVEFEPGSASRVELDPEQFMPDVDRSDNVWQSEQASRQ